MKITIEVITQDQSIDKMMTPCGYIRPVVIDQIERAIHNYLNTVEGNVVIDCDPNCETKITIQGE